MVPRTMAGLFGLLCLGLLTPPASALFEDQAFKFDWRHTHVGVPVVAKWWELAAGAKSSLSSSAGDSALLVATDKAVLAAIDGDSGELRWRQKMAEEDGERFLELAVLGDQVAATLSAADGAVVLRQWHPANGALISERSLAATSANDVDLAFIQDGEAHLLSLTERGLHVDVFDVKKSAAKSSAGRSIDLSTGGAGAGQKDGLTCSHTGRVLACLHADRRLLYHVALPLQPAASAMTVVSLGPLGLPDSHVPVTLRSVPGSNQRLDVVARAASGAEQLLSMTFAVDGGRLLRSHLTTNAKSSVSLMTGCKNTDDWLSMEQACDGPACLNYQPSVKINKWRGPGQSYHEVQHTYPHPVGRIVQAWATCEDDQDGSGGVIYQLVMLAEDGSLTSLTPTPNVMWTREESLAGIRHVELLPAPEQEDEGVDGGYPYGESAPTDIVEQLVKRFRRHGAMLNSAFTHLLEKNYRYFMPEDTSIDDFGIRKVAVAVTDRNKVVGIDSKNGQVLWNRRFPGQGGKPDDLLQLFVLRSVAGMEPKCALVYRRADSEHPELLTFNPNTGEAYDTKALAQDLAQVLLLHHFDEDHVRPLLLLRSGHQTADLEPRSAAKHLAGSKSFVVVTDKATSTLAGHRLVVSADSGAVRLSQVWSLTHPNTNILSVTGKPSDEHVHSQGRVMADRSVLFKYVNPNLALVMTEGQDAAGKNFINVYLVDLVTGRVVFSANHKRVTGPYHVVHSENWAVYTYYNEKARRGELTSLELFEGSTQSNSTVFSSLSSTVQPLVERQSFILGPTHIRAVRDTVTEKGITTKHLLMASGSTGSVYDVPRHVLDPRRPNLNTPPERREPGLPPYVPEIQLPQEMILNYNQSVLGVRGIATAPTGLESTSVAFVYGLDVYCTRVTPSKGFDLLKDDFDYYIISLVLLGLVAAAFVTRRLSQRKNLKQAWR